MHFLHSISMKKIEFSRCTEKILPFYSIEPPKKRFSDPEFALHILKFDTLIVFQFFNTNKYQPFYHEFSKSKDVQFVAII